MACSVCITRSCVVCPHPQSYATTDVLYHIKKGYFHQGSSSTLCALDRPQAEIFIDIKGWGLSESLGICRQLAQCIQCLHKDDIMHGSISPGCIRCKDGRSMGPASDINITLQHAGLYQAAYGEQEHMRLPEATRYTAPEHLESDGFIPTKEGDVYGWAAVSYAILCGVPLFSKQPDERCVGGIVNGGWMGRLRQPEGVSSEIWQLLRDCLNRDPAARPSISEVVRRLDKESPTLISQHT